MDKTAVIKIVDNFLLVNLKEELEHLQARSYFFWFFYLAEGHR